mgnify:CR=1 FL=1
MIALLGLAPVRNALIGLAIVAAAYVTGYINGRSDGKAIAAKAAVEATINQLKERGMINEAVRNLDARSLCIELGGLPDECGK